MKHLHYGWVMVIITVCVLAMHSFAFFSFGIFLVPLTTEFNWDRGALSAALSLTNIIAGVLGMLAGRLSDRYGPRFLVTMNGVLSGIAFFLLSRVNALWHVYLIWGILLAIAAGCIWAPTISSIPRWFIKKRGLALGIAFAGFGLGGIISPPLAQQLISNYGWRQAYIILGLIIFAIITPLAQFMKHSPQRAGLRPYGEEDEDSRHEADIQRLVLTTEELTFGQALKTGRFWLIGFLQFCFFCCVGIIVVHIAPYALDVGIGAVIAAGILSVCSGGSAIGRLYLGFVADRIGTERVLIACLGVATLSLVWLVFAKEAWMFYLFAVAFGAAWGGTVPLLSLLPPRLFGLGSLGTIMAGLVLFSTAGSALGAPLAGSIFDVTRSYYVALLICVALCSLATILGFMLLRMSSKEDVVSSK